MGITSKGFRYPELEGVAPNVPQDIENLAEDVDAYLVEQAVTALTGIASGWAVVGTGCWAQRSGNVVLVHFSLQNATFSNSTPTSVAHLPGGFPSPAQIVDQAIAGSNFNRGAQIDTSGNLQMSTAGATAAFYVGNLLYLV